MALRSTALLLLLLVSGGFARGKEPREESGSDRLQAEIQIEPDGSAEAVQR